jgi:hypothetical protein
MPTGHGAAVSTAAAPAAALSRRGLLQAGTAWTGMMLAGGVLGSAAPAASPPSAPAGTMSAKARRAFETRLAAARLADPDRAARHPCNGDEAELAGGFACFSKALPHNALGEVDAAAYGLLLAALRSGSPVDFERIPLGGFVKLANPQGALAMNLIGPDPECVELAPPPRFASAEQGGELVELYWQALLRDVAFADYESHPLARQAAEDLSARTAFHGPRGTGGRVTPATLFRGAGAASLEGPYVSQFLYKDVFLPPRPGSGWRPSSPSSRE